MISPEQGLETFTQFKGHFGRKLKYLFLRILFEL